jgi:hypothetical protein
MTCGAPAQATMPPNPDSPLAVTDCAQARRRLALAERGSPLQNFAEQKATLRRAHADVDRLCKHWRHGSDRQP